MLTEAQSQEDRGINAAPNSSVDGGLGQLEYHVFEKAKSRSKCRLPLYFHGVSERTLLLWSQLYYHGVNFIIMESTLLLWNQLYYVDTVVVFLK